MASIGTSTVAYATQQPTGQLVFVASDRTVCVLWCDGTNQKCSYASPPYSAWTTTTLVTGLNMALGGKFRVASDNIDLVTGAASTVNPTYYSLTKVGATWTLGTAKLIISTAAGTAAVGNVMSYCGQDAQGRHWVVCGGVSTYLSSRGLRSSTSDPTGSWTSNISTTQTSDVNLPCGDIIGNYLLKTYWNGTAIQVHRLDVSVATLGSWNTPVTIPNLGGSPNASSRMTLRAISATQGLLVYSTGSGMYAQTYTPGTNTWSTAVQLSTGANDRHPTIATDGAGNAWVFWCSYAAANSYALVYKKWDGVAWDTSPTTLVASGTNIANPQAGYGAGLVGVAYTVGTGNPYTVGWASISLIVTSTRTITTTAAFSALPVGPATGDWVLAWNDEFNDGVGMSGPTHGLLPAKWNCGWWSGPSSPGVGNTVAISDPVNSSAITYFGPASLLFPGDGALHLRLQAGVDNGGTYNTRTVESGTITTAGLMNLNPGNVAVSTSSPDLRPYTINGACVLEVRCRVPGPNASAGAYWTWLTLTNAGNYGGANPNGTNWPGGQSWLEEIDLVEWYADGSLGAGGIFNFHAASSYGGMSSIPAAQASTDMSVAYHTYTYVLTTSTLVIYVDGVLVTGVTPSSAQIRAQWVFPQYLIISFEALAGAVYPTTAASTPNDLMIDYVRVWHTPVLTKTRSVTTTAALMRTVTAHPPYAAVITGNTPLAWWRVNEVSGMAANDSSGNGETATLTGVTTYADSGTIVRDSDTSIATSAMGGLTLPSSLDFSGAYGIEFWLKQGGVWEYIGIDYDGASTLTIYHNGVPSIPDARIPTGSKKSFALAGISAAGNLDEIVVYSRLTQAMVTADYQAGTVPLLMVPCSLAVVFPQGNRTVPCGVSFYRIGLRTTPVMGVLIASQARPVPSTSALSSEKTRAISVTGALFNQSRTRTLGTGSDLFNQDMTRGISVTATLLNQGVACIVPTNAALSITRVVPCVAPLARIGTRSIGGTSSLTIERSRASGASVSLLFTGSRTSTSSAAFLMQASRTLGASVSLSVTRIIPASVALFITRVIPASLATSLLDQSHTMASTTALGMTQIRTVGSDTALLSEKTRPAIGIASALSRSGVRTLGVTTSLFITRSIPASVILGNMNATRSLGASIPLLLEKSRTTLASTPILGQTVRSIDISLALLLTQTRGSAGTVALSRTYTRDAGATVALSLLGTHTRTVGASTSLSGGSRTLAVTGSIAVVKTSTASLDTALSLEKTRPAVAASASLFFIISRNVVSTVPLLVEKSRSCASSARLFATFIRTCASTVSLQGGVTRTLPTNVALIFTGERAFLSDVSLSAGKTRTMTADSVLAQEETRSGIAASATLSLLIQRNVASTVPLLLEKSRQVTCTLSLTIPLTRTLTSSAALQGEQARGIAASSALLEGLNTRTIGSSTALSLEKVRSGIGASGALLATMQRTSSGQTSLLGTRTRSVAMTGAYLTQGSREVPATVALLLPGSIAHTIPTGTALSDTRARVMTAQGALEIRRVMPCTVAFSEVRTRDIPAVSSLTSGRDRYIPCDVALSSRKARVMSTSVAFVRIIPNAVVEVRSGRVAVLVKGGMRE